MAAFCTKQSSTLLFDDRVRLVALKSDKRQSFLFTISLRLQQQFANSFFNQPVVWESTPTGKKSAFAKRIMLSTFRGGCEKCLSIISRSIYGSSGKRNQFCDSILFSLCKALVSEGELRGHVKLINLSTDLYCSWNSPQFAILCGEFTETEIQTIFSTIKNSTNVLKH